MSIAVITDTDSSLPPDLAAQYGIRQVPIGIHLGAETRPASEISDAEVFKWVNREGKLPTTSAPSPGQFVEAYQAAFDQGADSVVCICVSSVVSGVFNAAVAARDLLPERDIVVIDSRSLSIQQGFMALAAAEAAASGASKDEVVRRAQEIRERTHLYAALSTLKYLAMSGRVGYLAAGMGGLLSVQPILTIRDGKLDLLEKVRTRRRALARVTELLEQAAGGRPIERLAVVHACIPEEAQVFGAQLCAQMGFSSEPLLADLTPGLSVHAGAGLLGAAIVVKE